VSGGPDTLTGARVRRLTDVSRALTYATSLDEVLALAVDCATDLLEAERGVVLLHGDDGLLHIHAHRGVPDEAVSRFQEPLDETIVARMEGVFGPRARQGFLGVPLVVGGRIRGVVAVLRGTDSAVADEEEWLLSALADQLAVALENARRGETAERLEAELKRVADVRANTERAIQIAGHDLRTPLNSIQGYLELVNSGVFGPLSDRQTEVLGRVQAIAKHLQAVLDDIMSMVLPSAQEASVREVSAAKIVGQAISLVSPAAQRKRIEIRTRLEEGLRVSCYPDRLRQVLIHLLDNAVKYSPPGTEVLVRSSAVQDERGTRCEITVTDQGPGIPIESAEKAFQPGERLDSPGADPGGTGLGLSIARTLIQFMGGTITLAEGASGGATFVIRLPAADEAAEARTRGP